MAKVSVSFRTDEKKVRQLDKLAKQQRCDRTQLIDEAIDSYISWREHQLALIDEGIRQADAGDFASEDEVQAAFARWRR